MLLLVTNNPCFHYLKLNNSIFFAVIRDILHELQMSCCLLTVKLLSVVLI